MTTQRNQRDMTEAEFKRRLRANGFEPPGFGPFGYVALPAPCDNVHVCRHNGGNTFRAQLAYLIREKERALAKFEGFAVEWYDADEVEQVRLFRSFAEAEAFSDGIPESVVFKVEAGVRELVY